MEFVQAHFSLKFQPQRKIRKKVDLIERALEEHYRPPMMMPIPDDIAVEIPRIVLTSKSGHSQISFSLISVDFDVHFDGSYQNDFQLTKQYILERISILSELLMQINIQSFYFAGISYNIHLDTNGKTPVLYMQELLGASVKGQDNVYEASQRVAVVEKDAFFVNQQIGTYKEYEGKGNGIPDLLDFNSSELVDEGVNLALDVNNRYDYMQNGKLMNVDKINTLLADFYTIIEKWQKKMEIKVGLQ